MTHTPQGYNPSCALDHQIHWIEEMACKQANVRVDRDMRAFKTGRESGGKRDGDKVSPLWKEERDPIYNDMH